MKTHGDGRKTIPTATKNNNSPMKKFHAFILILIITLSAANISVFGYDDTIPAPDWITESTTTDGSKVITITTPTYMLDKVDYYEYSTDNFITVDKLSDNTGGELIYASTVTFYLRYSSNGFMSETYTFDVIVTRVEIITNQSTGISLLIPFDSPMPTDVTLQGYEITGGNAFNSAKSHFGENKKFRLFNIAVMRDNSEYQTDTPYHFLFPCGDYSADYCEIYSMDSKGNITLLESSTDMNTRTIKTMNTGLFILVEDKTYCIGDMNGDGKIQANDARLALRISAKIESADAQQSVAGDVNRNGRIDAADARLILRAAASLEKIN